MKHTSVKKNIWSCLAAIVITSIFVGGMCMAFQTECNRILYLIILGVAYLVSIWLLFAIAYNKNRQGHIIVNEHSK